MKKNSILTEMKIYFKNKTEKNHFILETDIKSELKS